MKKHDWILLLATLTYSFLFYEEMAGVNFFIFSVALIALLATNNKKLIRQTSWVAMSVCALATGVAIMLYGDRLSIIANVLSLAILSGLSINNRTSLFLTLVISALSVVGSLVFMILDLVSRIADSKKSPSDARQRRKYLFGFAMAVVILLFYFLYRASNPIFHELTKGFSLDFITPEWVVFTLFGFFILYGFFNYRNFQGILNRDANAANVLSAHSYPPALPGHEKSGFSEIASGTTLLLLLNLLILSVNAIDVNYLLVGSVLPEGVAYSDFVHQGIGALIFSILVAISIILYYFRGSVNFANTNKWIRLLAILWIVQNILMACSTIYRNNLYIEEFGLTQKRIGVYFYLALTIIGLILTLIKVGGRKSNYYLFRTVGWSFFTVMVLSCYYDWNGLITRYNILRAASETKTVDASYLNRLSDSNLNALVILAKNDSIRISDPPDSGSDWPITNYQGQTWKSMLHSRIYVFLKKEYIHGWKSWCAARKKTTGRLIDQCKNGNLAELNLFGCGVDQLYPLQDLKWLKSLDVSQNQISDLRPLASFAELESLNLSNNWIDSMEQLPTLVKLKVLGIGNNNIQDGLQYLDKLPNLEVLNLFQTNLRSLSEFPELKKLTSINLSGNVLADFQPLKSSPLIKDLNLTGTLASGNILVPELNRITNLNLSENQLENTDTLRINPFTCLRTVQHLDVSGNQFWNLKPLTIFPGLTTLNVSNNLLQHIRNLDAFPNLTEFRAWQNGVISTTGLKDLTKLKVLYLSDNQIKDLSGVSSLSRLEELYLSRNQIVNAKALSGCTELITLDLASNKICDLNFLSGLDSLSFLDLSNNRINDIKPLEKLVNLNTLKLKGNQINNAEVLSQLGQLKELAIDVLNRKELKKLFRELPGVRINGMLESESFPINPGVDAR